MDTGDTCLKPGAGAAKSSSADWQHPNGNGASDAGEKSTDLNGWCRDYRGVTAAAIEAMLAGGFQEVVSAGLSAALEKAASLQRESERT